MRRPPLRIEPATLADLPALAPIHRLAFFPGAITQYCFRDVSPSNFDAWFVKRFTGVLEKRDKGEKVEVLVGKRADKPVALVYYGLEPELEKREKADTPRQFPEGANVEQATDILGQMDAHIKKIPFAHCCASPHFSHLSCRAELLVTQPGTSFPSIQTLKGPV